MVSMMGLLSFGLIAGYWNGPATPFHCSLKLLADGSAPLYPLSTAFALIFLFFSYSDRLGRLVEDPNDTEHSLHPNRESVLHLAIFFSNPKLNIDAVEYRRIIKQVVSSKNIADREAMISRASKKPALKSLAFYVSGLQRYSDSFLASIPTLFFGSSYGISQVSFSRWYQPPVMTEDVNTMTFGQIVPLFLLALPALAAAEIYYGNPLFTG